MFEVELKLSERSKDLLRRMPDLVIPALYKGMRAAMIEADRHARLSLSGPVLQRRSGRLRSSIDTDVRIAGNTVIGRIGTNVIYARIHELGGVIRPKTKKALRFQIPGVGWRSTKQVIMPARPYLRPAISQQLDLFGRILSEHIERAFDEVK